MSPRLPTLTADRLVSILKDHGFEPVRQSGSHLIMKYPDGRRTTIPIHKGRDLGRGLLRQIMRDAELSVEDMVE